MLVAGARLHLVHGALARRLVRTPAQELGAVAEPAAREMIVADLHHQLRRERLPLARALRAPPTRTPWRAAGEARGLDEPREHGHEPLALLRGQGGGEA